MYLFYRTSALTFDCNERMSEDKKKLYFQNQHTGDQTNKAKLL